MTDSSSYQIEPYNKVYRKIFAGVYNDFKNSAAKDYRFELPPVDYEKFIKSVEDGLLQCILLLEDGIPTGFLVYTTLISESIELNIIHCIGDTDINKKRRMLVEKFIELNKELMKKKITTYPMLGRQMSFASEIAKCGFRTVNTSVMSFNLTDVSAIHKVKDMMTAELPEDYTVTDWQGSYLRNAAEIIYFSFKGTTDPLFDSRFTTYRGCTDIASKITGGIYGKFLPKITKVLLYKGAPAGFCLVNLTNENIANIPIAAILKEHRGRGLSRIMMKKLIYDLLSAALVNGWSLKELNASCDSDNEAAVKMYKSAGFTEDYTYLTAYHSGLG